MNRGYIIRFLILRTVGNFLILFALFGVTATFGPALYYEIIFKLNQARGIHYSISNSNNNYATNFANIANASNQQILTPQDTFFDVLIPKIGANAKVFPNIDPSNENEYLSALKKGVAHARGTVFPGIVGTTYIFAHSTDNFWDVGRYNAVFYLLKDLQIGDQVVIFFKDKRYNYTVSDKKITQADDVSYIVKAQKTPEQLVLQTCWPPGTDWKRLLIIAKPQST